MNDLARLDASFWVPAFGFLGVCVTSAFGLIKMLIVRDQKRAQGRLSVERYKSDMNARAIDAIQRTVDSLKPMLNNHASEISTLRSNIVDISKVQGQLNASYNQFAGTMKESLAYIQTAQKHLEGYGKRMSSIETQIVELGKNAFMVTSKKPNGHD